MIEVEVWKDIPGYDGRYQVSNLGRVKSIPWEVTYWRTNRWGTRFKATRIEPAKIFRQTVLRPDKGQSIYWQVGLRRGGETIRTVTHRLVLLAFVGPPRSGEEGCHNDGDGLNNRLDNLRWDTHAANHEDTVQHGRFQPAPPKRGSANPAAKLAEADVAEIRASPASVKNQTLANRFGVAFQTISKIRRGERWRHVDPTGRGERGDAAH